MQVFIIFSLLLVLPVSAVAQSSAAADCNALPASKALTEFLLRFDRIAKLGFVKTRRAGSTGVGYTFESLIQIEENNSPQGDLLGMEIKAYRSSELRFDDHKKMNLFLKEPVWADKMKAADRIRAYGYTDPNGRRAWYQSVTNQTNESGLRLEVDPERQMVNLTRNEQAIGHWTFAVLEKRLLEKHSETVFVAAETRGDGNAEEFHYGTVTYCAAPSIQRLIKLIQEGDVVLELRMHIKPTGGARNHGTAFRVRKHRLVDLYSKQRLCRPLGAK